MSDTALSEPRAAALESSGASNAMKPSTDKAWRGWRADVWGSHPAAGMETPDAGKTWGDRRADVDACGPAKPMQTTAPSKSWRRRRADVGNSGGVELMKIAAAKAAVESAAGKPREDGRGAGAETGRHMNACCAKAAGRRAWIDAV
jgi:hypothetical protein